MKRFLSPSILFLVFSPGSVFAAEPTRPPGEPIHLFNGHDLSGWYTFVRNHGKDNDPNKVFTVQDGLLHITGQDFGCITTHKEYENYRLVAEYKWGEKTWKADPKEQKYDRTDKARDNGIMIHSVGKDGEYWGAWMLSVEVQIIEGGVGDILLVNDNSDKSLKFAATVEAMPEQQGKCWQYQPGGKEQTVTRAARINWFGRDPNWQDVRGWRGPHDVEHPHGQWNHLEATTDGDSLKIVLNGVTVNHVTHLSPHRGKIQVQSEGAEIFYRKIDLIPLPSVPRPSESGG